MQLTPIWYVPHPFWIGLISHIANTKIPGGKGTYMTGVRQTTYSAESVKKSLDIIVETFKDTKTTVSLHWEFFPLNKVNAVPRNTMAFRRVTSQGVFFVLQWDGDSVLSPSFDSAEREKMTDKARVVAHKLANAIVSVQPKARTGEPFHLGYANVGMSFHFLS